MGMVSVDTLEGQTFAVHALKMSERGGDQEVKEVNTEVNLSEATKMYVSRPNSDRFWHR